MAFLKGFSVIVRNFETLILRQPCRHNVAFQRNKQNKNRWNKRYNWLPTMGNRTTPQLVARSEAGISQLTKMRNFCVSVTNFVTVTFEGLNQTIPIYFVSLWTQNTHLVCNLNQYLWKELLKWFWYNNLWVAVDLINGLQVNVQYRLLSSDLQRKHCSASDLKSEASSLGHIQTNFIRDKRRFESGASQFGAVFWSTESRTFIR